MNCLLITIVILNIFGVLECRHSDIDINRKVLLTKKLISDKNNDYDGNNGRSSDIFRSIASAAEKDPQYQSYQIHAPKEDPRQFYQSDIYLKEMRTASHLNEVSQIYPGREVIRGDESTYTNSVKPMRFMSANLQRYKYKRSKVCIKCPGDRTMVGKTELNLVLLNKPSLVTCTGKRSPKYVKLIHVDGPKFGSLLQAGSYEFTGNIMYKQEIIKYCKMRINVITQECFAPKDLSVKCSPETKICNFACTDSGHDLIGPLYLLCDSTKQWNGTLPHCKARPLYCDIPQAPENGRLSCESTSNDGRLPEGTKCKIYCNKGLRKNKRSSFCIRGKWTHTLTCRRRHLDNGTTNQNSTSTKHFISLKEFNK